MHDALVSAFKIPVGDKHIRLVAHPAHRFATAPHLEQPERYTLVTIDCFAGRSVQAKPRIGEFAVGRRRAM